MRDAREQNAVSMTLINLFAVGPEHEEGFVARFKATAEALRDLPGFLGTDLHRNAGIGDQSYPFVNIAKWASADDWRSALPTIIAGARSLGGGEASVIPQAALYESIFKLAPASSPPAGSAPAGGTGTAIKLTATVVVVAAMHWLAPVLTPLTLALFLMLMADGMARGLKSRAPSLGDASLGVALALCVTGFALVVLLMAESGSGLVGRLIANEGRLDGLVAAIAKPAGVAAPPVSQLVARVDVARWLPAFAGGLRGSVSYGVAVLVYFGFLLASRAGAKLKMERLFSGQAGAGQAAQVIVRVRTSLEQYVWIQTLCGGLIAVASGAVMAMIGLEGAVFWAFLFFVLNFIPIVGAAIGVAAPVIFALESFPNFRSAAILLAAMVAAAFVVGNILMPRLQGKSLNLDPVVLLFSLGFWGAIWGVTGAVLSTPLTLTAMVIMAQFPGSRWIAVLLSGDGDPGGSAEAAAPSTS
jgi:predicted PurR-regulated permease PerM